MEILRLKTFHDNHIMDSQWLKTQFQLHPDKSRADLARALDLDPPAISKILAGGRQIKAHEYIAMRRFFGLPVDGDRAVSGGYRLSPFAHDRGLSDRTATSDQDAWIMPAKLLESKTQAPPDKIRIFTVQDSSMEPDFMTGAQVLVDEFLGWFSWALVWVAFPAGILAAVAAVILGKVFSMPHVSKGGLIGVFVVLGAALLYLVIPGILSGFLGDGCVTR